MTDPAGPPGTDGRTIKALKNVSFRYFSSPPRPLLKGLFNKDFPINFAGGSPAGPPGTDGRTKIALKKHPKMSFA